MTLTTHQINYIVKQLQYRLNYLSEQRPDAESEILFVKSVIASIFDIAIEKVRPEKKLK